VRIAIGVGAGVVVVVVLAQALGPAIAARIVRGRVGRYGTVKSVKVKAWPAVKLVWGDADEVRVSAGRLKVDPRETVALLKEAKGVDRVDASAESVEEGPLRLTDARFEKHGSALRAEGVVSEEDVRRALPKGVEVALVKSEGGTVEVKVSGGLFGVSASVDAVARAQDGKLVARPTGLLLSGLKATVFEDPSVYVEGVEARVLESGQGEGRRYELSMWASLR
jgi:LmeA-like phospholipid-binding